MSELLDGSAHNPEDERLVEPHDRNGSHGEHPLLGSFIGGAALEAIQPGLDDVPTLHELEQQQRAIDFIRDWYLKPDADELERALGPLNGTGEHSVGSINNQFAKKIIPCLTNADRQTALEMFRAIIPNTVDEELVLLTNDEQFDELYGALSDHLDNSGEQIDMAVQANLTEIARADRMQFDGRQRRSLEQMRSSGLVISIDPANVSELTRANIVANEGILPVTEYVKNKKVLGVSGFMGSKVSLAVHDYMDHLWTFAMLEEAGMLEKYAHMFDAIGNPETTDIYKREGEIVASIAFGVRYFQNMPAAFGPIMRSSQIEEHLDNLFVAGELQECHMEAYRTIKSLRKGSREWQSLGFAFSNYITELDQQRRKYGRIKQRDLKTKKVIGELDPLSPDFVAFFIDTHHQLMSSKNKHRDDLFRFHILLEEYLCAYANGTIPTDQSFVIRLDELRKTDFTKTSLPPQRIKWMRDNYGFSATRDAII